MKEIIVKRELPSEEIKNIRNLIVYTAMDIDSASGKRLKLSDIDCSKESLDRIIFDRSIYNVKCIFHVLFRLKSRIDFDGVSFDGANISEADFTGSKGVRINPQTLCNKSLLGKYTDVEFIGPFDGINISSADFTGSKGVRINPQTLCSKNLSGKYTDVEFIGPFNNVDISSADFTGSKGAKINPQTIYAKDLYSTVCSDVEFTGSFDGVNLCCTDFTGSKGARINPQTIRNKNLWGTVCSGVEFTGSFDNVKMNDETSLDGSNARYIDSYERVKESIKKLIK